MDLVHALWLYKLWFISLDRKKTSFGDPNMTFPICWDTSGKYFTSLGKDHARIWSTASSRKFIFELKSNGNKFESCTFHPEY
jgi:WD40 repeat protein